VREFIADLVENGKYPERLFEVRRAIVPAAAKLCSTDE
jgi:hypothetical protein